MAGWLTRCAEGATETCRPGSVGRCCGGRTTKLSFPTFMDPIWGPAPLIINHHVRNVGLIDVANHLISLVNQKKAFIVFRYGSFYNCL